MRSVLIGVVMASLVAACSGTEPSPSSAPTTVNPAPASTPTPTPTPPVILTGGDAGMHAVLTTLYAGASGITATATTGVWEKERTAVVVAGEDLTLLTAPASTTTWKVVGGWWPSLKKPAALGRYPRFVVALGIDARPNKSLKGARADTLQIAGMDGKGGGGILGVARDTWVALPGGGKGKINSAWSRAGGPAQVQALKSLTRLPIEGYVATGFSGFRGIVNEWGGIPISIPKAIRGSASGVRLKAGSQVLNGTSALAYARERKALADGDFGRSRHQGDLMLAIAIKAKLAGVGSIPKALTIVSKYSETNLTAAQVLTFAAATYRLSPRAVGHAVVKGATPTIAGQSVVIPDAKSKAAMLAFRDGRL